jgi:hypothetical protein
MENKFSQLLFLKIFFVIIKSCVLFTVFFDDSFVPKYYIQANRKCGSYLNILNLDLNFYLKLMKINFINYAIFLNIKMFTFVFSEIILCAKNDFTQNLCPLYKIYEETLKKNIF